MITGFHHAAISTGDMDRALEFYCGLLGFEKLFENTWPVGSEAADAITGLKDSSARMAMLKIGDAHIELFQFSSPTPKPGDQHRPVSDHGITHICVTVTDIEAEYERLKAAGMVFHCPPRASGPGSLCTYGRDPDGNVVELLQQGA